MMKADVLSDLDTIKICTHYNYEGKTINSLPYDVSAPSLSPIYKDFPGWKTDLRKVTADNLPPALENYIHFIEQEVHVPVSIISVGPDRTQTLERSGILV
jgi:adenylosuccinate synthase